MLFRDQFALHLYLAVIIAKVKPPSIGMPDINVLAILIGEHTNPRKIQIRKGHEFDF